MPVCAGAAIDMVTGSIRRSLPDQQQAAWVVLTAATSVLVGVLAAGPVGPRVGLVVVALLAVTAVAAQPARGLLTLLVLLPFGFYIGSLGGFSLFAWLPLILIAAMLILIGMPVAPALARSVDLPIAAFASLVAIAAMSAFASSDPRTASTRLVYVIAFGVVCAGVARLLAAGRISVRQLVRLIVASGVLVGLVLIGQFAWALSVGPDAALQGLKTVYPLFGGERAADTSLGNWYVPNIGTVRGIVPFMAPPSAGQYMMVVFVLSTWLALHPKRTMNPGRAWLRWATVILLGLALICTFSRQAWFGAGVGLVLIGLRGSFHRVAPAAVLAAVVFMLVNVPGTNQTLAHHLIEAGNTSDESGAGRVALWNDAFHQIAERPLLGVGPGLYSTLNPFGKGAYYAHNLPLDAAVELGIIGAVVVIWLFVSLLTRAARNSPTLALPALGAYAAANLVDDVTYFPRNGFLLAVIVAMACFSAAGRETAGTAALGRGPLRGAPPPTTRTLFVRERANPPDDQSQRRRA